MIRITQFILVCPLLMLACDFDKNDNLDAVLYRDGTGTDGGTFGTGDTDGGDDGGTVGTDGGTGDPSLPVCGNGVIEGTEECDDGNSNHLDACRNTCKTPKCPEIVTNEPVVNEYGIFAAQICQRGL